MKKYVIAAAIAATALSGTAIAQWGGKDRAKSMLARADTDKNGQISRAEFFAQAAQRFVKLDANKDGKLADAELKRRMARAATASDGAVTRTEFELQTVQRFRALDRDGNGSLSVTELPQRGGRHHGRHGGWRGGPGGMGPMIAERMFERLDANRDGRISRTEGRTAADARFDRVDANKDGFIDKAEAKAAGEAMRSRFGRGPGNVPPPPPAAPGAPGNSADQ